MRLWRVRSDTRPKLKITARWFASLTTKPFGVPTIVSLNTVMIDGTGMCGGCRVSVGGKSLFACVDGPFFDAHQVDFDEADDRLRTYEEQEKLACKLAGLGR